MVILFSVNEEGIRKYFAFNQNQSDTFFTWSSIKHKIPTLMYFCMALVLTIFAVIKSFSLIPMLGLLTNLYLMSELGITNWLRFLIWLAIGLVLYFTYGNKHSKLREVHT
jgi:hypothetical protein